MTATKIAPRQKSHHIKMSREDKIYNIVGIILFTIITLLCVYPFYYLMICTISDQKLVDLNQIILLPKGINFENYVEIFKVQNLGNAAFISVARTVITTALSLVLTATWPTSSPSRICGSASSGIASPSLLCTSPQA